eukprot:COSAG02_NODE_8278_length_2633_cov_2.093923_2_plen_77_part_00
MRDTKIGIATEIEVEIAIEVEIGVEIGVVAEIEAEIEAEIGIAKTEIATRSGIAAKNVVKIPIRERICSGKVRVLH